MTLLFLIHFSIVLAVKALNKLLVLLFEASSCILMLLTQIFDRLLLLRRHLDFLML